MHKFSVRYFLLVAILLIFLLLILKLQLQTSITKTEVDITKIPLDIGKWKGTEIPVDRETKDILETENVLMRQYRNSEGDSINLSIVYYKDSRIALHLPESCLLGHGSRLTNRELELIVLPNGQKFYATKLTIKNKLSNNLVIYYFESGELKSRSYLAFRWKVLLNKIRSNNSSGALIRFTINTSEDNLQEKLPILKEFIRTLVPMLPQYFF